MNDSEVTRALAKARQTMMGENAPLVIPYGGNSDRLIVIEDGLNALSEVALGKTWDPDL